MGRRALGEAGPSDRAILLLTDGEDLGGEARAAAQRAADEGIHIYAIGFGTTDGAPIPTEEGGFKKDRSGDMVLSRLDEDLLRDVAATTAGAYVRATAGAADVTGLYAGEIQGKLRHAETGARREKIWDERFQWPLAAAFLLLVGADVAARLRRPARAMALLALLALVPMAARSDDELDRLLAEQVERPDDLALAERVGEALYRAGQYERAERVLDGVAARSKDADQQTRARYNAALSAYKGGKLTQSIDRWSRGLEAAPGHAETSQNLEAAKKELQMRLQEPPPEQQEQQQQEQEQRQGSTEQEQGGQQQEQQEEAQGEPLQAERQEQGPEGEIQPQDGADEPEPASEAMPSGDTTAEQARRFLDSLEEGQPRVPVSPGSRGGRDW
jgi:Ca-activated chloride channel family protein